MRLFLYLNTASSSSFILLIKIEIASLTGLHKTEQKTEKPIIFKYFVFYG